MDEGRTIAGHGTPEEWLEHAGWVRALARALVRDTATADDVVQDTWLAALRRAPRGSGAVRPWLARIVRNAATDRARAETRRTDREARVEHDPRHEPAPDQVAESIETQKLLLAAVERLQDPLRSAVVRRYFHGKTSIEIAREDNVAESTVRERIERGLQALRRDLDAHHRGDRGAWMAVLVPIARRTDARVAAGSTAVVATGMGLAMATMWKIAVAALVVVAALVGARALMTTPVAVNPLAANAHSSALDEVARIGDGSAPSSRSNAATGDESAAAQTAATSVPIDRIAYVEARIVDKSGAPISDARLTCLNRFEDAVAGRKEPPSAACGPDGHVRLELGERESGGNGRLGDWPDTSWTTSLRASAAHFAPHDVELMLDEGQTSSCGTIVLAEGGTVVGRVVDEHGEGLSDATVHVVLPDLSLDERDRLPWAGISARSLAYAQSATDGNFRFEGVPVGNYRVWTNFAGRECADELVEVNAGSVTTLTPLLMSEYANAIRGTVIGLDGHPQAARILYAPNNHAANDRWREFDVPADGRFALNVVPGSIVDIESEERDDRRKPAWALRTNIATGTRDVVLQMSSLPMMDVVAQDVSGKALELWNLNQHEPAGGGCSWMNFGPKHVRIPASGLPFTLEFNAAGFTPRTFGPYDPLSAPPSLVVTLERANLLTVRITGGGRTISNVRVRENTLLTPGVKAGNGFPLRLANESGGWERDPDGTLAFTADNESPRVLVILPWGSDGEDAPDGFARTEIGPLVVGSIPDHNLDVELTRGGRLEGRVIGFSPSTSTMSFVSVSRGDGVVRSARVQPDGSYGFEHMTAGEWLVRPTERNWTDVLSTTTAPPEPGNIAVTIIEGATTKLDLSIPKTSGATLDGSLSITGMEADTWTAHLASPDGDGSHVDVPVAADGSFHMELHEGGRHHLSLRTAPDANSSRSIDCDVDLAPGANTWRFAPEVGAISQTSTQARDLALECRSPEGVVWTAQWRTSGSGPEILDSVPAGDVKITSGGRVLSTVHVQPHEVATVVCN